MGNWFVANDVGNIIGHDMNEAEAKTLARQMQEQEPDEGWKALSDSKYYIIARRIEGGFPQDFTVGYDNKATIDYDNYMTFDTKEEALEWTKSDAAKQWVGCTFDILPYLN